MFGVKSNKKYKHYLSKITARIININRASKKFKVPVFDRDNQGLVSSVDLFNFFKAQLVLQRNYEHELELPLTYLIEDLVPHLNPVCFYSN